MTAQTVKYPFVIYPASEGGFVAEVPALKGCLAQGETLDETIDELAVVADLWIATARQHGDSIPDPELEIERVKQKLAA